MLFGEGYVIKRVKRLFSRGPFGVGRTTFVRHLLFAKESHAYLLAGVAKSVIAIDLGLICLNIFSAAFICSLSIALLLPA